ncbi:MAG TPA: glycosyltransferase family 4 protein [Steroidobacteraceae bacterium]|nr:glycosyltransferase family 4 protein [Steroidobacteraceae bacterium]
MPQSPCASDILIITAQMEPPVRELAQRLGGEERVTVYCSGAVDVWGERRGRLAKAAYFILDPLVTMIRLARRVWRYKLVICYYHRNGYWLGILNRLIGRRRGVRLAWIGFAPNPKRPGLRGRLKELITRHALAGCDLVICNTRPLIGTIAQRYGGIREKLAFVRWGGGTGKPPPENLKDGGYVFCGGRTNRDFDTVLEAVTRLGVRTILVVGETTRFRRDVPDFVTVHRNIPPSRFQSLIEEAGVVVIALERPDISSGQVVLMQAMRCAKPIVVSATAGIDDYVADGVDVLLFEPGSAPDLAARLQLILGDAGRRRALGEAAGATYDSRFNSAAFARDLSAALLERQLVPTPGGGGRAAGLGVSSPSW